VGVGRAAAATRGRLHGGRRRRRRAAERVAGRGREPQCDGGVGQYAVGHLPAHRLSHRADSGVWTARHLDGPVGVPYADGRRVLGYLEAWCVGIDRGVMVKWTPGSSLIASAVILQCCVLACGASNGEDPATYGGEAVHVSVKAPGMSPEQASTALLLPLLNGFSEQPLMLGAAFKGEAYVYVMGDRGAMESEPAVASRPLGEIGEGVPVLGARHSVPEQQIEIVVDSCQ